MTDNEIIKALECCAKYEWHCDNNCPFFKKCSKTLMAKSSLNIINRQKAEILELQKRIINWRTDMDYRPDEIKSEAMKEFAERLKEKFGIADCIVTVNNNDIEDLVEEMTEENEK